MNITYNSGQTSLPSVALKGSGLLLFFAPTHPVSDGTTGTLFALLPTRQSHLLFVRIPGGEPGSPRSNP